MIKEGTIVKVIDKGCEYSTYEEWMQKNAQKFLKDWYGYSDTSCLLENGDVGIVLKVAKHGDKIGQNKDKKIALIFCHSNVYMIGTEGLKENC